MITNTTINLSQINPNEVNFITVLSKTEFDGMKKTETPEFKDFLPNMIVNNQKYKNYSFRHEESGTYVFNNYQAFKVVLKTKIERQDNYYLTYGLEKIDDTELSLYFTSRFNDKFFKNPFLKKKTVN